MLSRTEKHPADRFGDDTCMNSGDPWQRFQGLRVWTDKRRRAPHKPLLALWAIGRCLRNEPRLAHFELIDRELTRLLRRFGPHRKVIHTEFPFWRMSNDDVWEVERPHLVSTTSKGDAHKSSLMKHDIRGGLLEADYETLRNDPELARRVAKSLAEAHFPGTLHDDIFRSVGIEIGTLDHGDSEPRHFSDQVREIDGFVEYRRRRRDSTFSKAVLDAYDSQCAVCEFAVRVEDTPVALDAAHIKWHGAAGPSEISNGLALCALHHRLFDYGVFTMLDNLEIRVLRNAGGRGFPESLGKFDGKFMRTPSRREHWPAARYLRWHRSEVFKSHEEYL